MNYIPTRCICPVSTNDVPVSTQTVTVATFPQAGEALNTTRHSGGYLLPFKYLCSFPFSTLYKCILSALIKETMPGNGAGTASIMLFRRASNSAIQLYLLERFAFSRKENYLDVEIRYLYLAPLATNLRFKSGEGKPDSTGQQKLARLKKGSLATSWLRNWEQNLF